MPSAGLKLLFSLALLGFRVLAASSTCSTSLTPTQSIQPSVASGYRYALVATGLTKPRSMAFDSAGNLLVVEAGSGISSHVLQDDGGICVSAKSSKMVIENESLNHGMALSANSTTLFASSADAVVSWSYDPSSAKITSDRVVLVHKMLTSDHTARTLLLSSQSPSFLLVTRGSTSNLDEAASDPSSGHSQIRAFDITSGPLPYDYSTGGILLGRGLRNSEGVAEHPSSGGIYSVENSVDELTRDGVNVHEDNPGEEMNYHGTLAHNTFAGQGSDYGYPKCFAAWKPEALPQNANISVGMQFAIGDQKNGIDDAYCAKTTPPRLTFQAHTAPIDIKFPSPSEAYISFHGSWDRTNPIGYKVSRVAFDSATGMPVDSPDSTGAAADVFYNADLSVCPEHCFRPAGLVFDHQGRLFVSSDASGEIYVIIKDSNAGGDGATASTSATASATAGAAGGSTGTATGSAAAATSSSSASGSSSGLRKMVGMESGGWALVGLWAMLLWR